MRVISFENSWARYGLAVGTVAGLTLVRAGLAPWLGDRSPLLLYMLAVVVTARLAGFMPGLLATGLSALAGTYLFIEPRFGLAVHSLSAAANVLLFLITAVLLCAFGGALRTATARLASSSRQLAEIVKITEEGLAKTGAGDARQVVLRRVRALLGADGVALFRMGSDGQHLVLDAVDGIDELRPGFELPVGLGVSGEAARTARALRVADIHAAPEPLNGLRSVVPAIHGVLAVPLATGERIAGVLTLVRREQRPFDEAEEQLLSVMAGRLALVLEVHRLVEAERTARREAEALSRAKDEFVATISHEVRTPLNVIHGWLWRLRQGPTDPEMLEHGLEVMNRNLQVQIRLIEDLLDVSRAITGKLQLRVSIVELPSIVERAVDVVRPAAEAKNIRIDVHAAPEVGAVLGDTDRLQQIVWNLLSNAVKFTPAGGRVDVRMRREGIHHTLIVTDTGVGIDPAFLPHVFERFRQADGSTTRAYGGLGLGLAIVRQLVELHGGTTEAHSQGPHLGATFVVRLPVPPLLQEHGAVQPDEMPAVDLAGVCVLVVEDDADAREAVALVLRQFGATVLTAGSAREALARVSEKPHVLLTDIAMPGEDGLRLLELLRQHEEEGVKRMRVAALTALSGPEHRERVLGAGADAYLTKPIPPPELALRVRELATGRPLLH